MKPSKYLTVCGCGHRFPPKQIAATCPCGTIVAKNTPEGLTLAATMTADLGQQFTLLARAERSA